jgi:uncharacterized repeat protein (TIGR03803 family)
VAPLVQATDGNFYGTTVSGAAVWGTIIRVTPQGVVTTIHALGGLDGAYPRAGLIQATDGNLYGTAIEGGSQSGPCAGTFFGISLSGTFKLLYDFTESAGCGPSPILQATDGNFYGTTWGGGTYGVGTVFKVTRTGVYTTLYNFNSAKNGPSSPEGNLVQASNGNFYGVTTYGGPNYAGGIFECTATGELKNLYAFSSAAGFDNDVPQLIQATDGNLYGTATSGGTEGSGAIFKMTLAGAYSTIYSFSSPDGANPTGLFQNTDGNLYGTTFQGGTDNNGVLFSLSLGIAPFVKTIPTAAAVGTPVTIYGTDLTGATSVSFNGTPATFTVVSATEISTTVPTGATTGTIEVVTPGATLYSVKFKVGS